MSKYLNIRSILRAPLTVSSFTPGFFSERTTPPISVVICVSTAKLISPSGLKRNRNRLALELPRSEQLKLPSASVRPHSQNSFNVGVTSVGIYSTRGNWPLIRYRLLKASRNRAKFTCLRGNTRFPLNSSISNATMAKSSTTKRQVLAPCLITRPNLNTR